jgi:hypothetical protein
MNEVYVCFEGGRLLLSFEARLFGVCREGSE